MSRKPCQVQLRALMLQIDDVPDEVIARSANDLLPIHLNMTRLPDVPIPFFVRHCKWLRPSLAAFGTNGRENHSNVAFGVMFDLVVTWATDDGPMILAGDVELPLCIWDSEEVGPQLAAHRAVDWPMDVRN